MSDPEEVPVDSQPQAQDEEAREFPPNSAAETGDEELPTFFAEKDEVLGLIADVRANAPIEGLIDVALGAKCDKFISILQRYQEQPQLVKAHLSTLVPPLVAVVEQCLPKPQALDASKLFDSEMSNNGDLKGLGNEFEAYEVDAPRTLLHHICRCLYTVSKVVGHKSITAHFAHDVALMETVLFSLSRWQTEPKLHPEWEVKYVLLLWLGNLILVPFALTSIDSSISSLPLASLLVKCSKRLVCDTTKAREGAAFFSGRMLSRPDVAEMRESYLLWCSEQLSSVTADDDTTPYSGVLLTLANIFKLGKRDELLAHALQFLPVIAPLTTSFLDTSSTKAAVKGVQRMALVCLEAQLGSWKYATVTSSLEANLAGTKQSDSPQKSCDAVALDGHDGVPEVVEEALDVLLRAIKHSDTVVRWSAAKGIGRVCDKLPMQEAKDVVAAVFEAFDVLEDDAAWHGGCLSLAELCRRRVLLPDTFAQLIPVTVRALSYDVSRGSYSVGSHVRDAACYVCWSVARAYKPADLVTYVDKISQALVATALFDREVHVRRAAAAAFQESVGRLGSFPNGIELVTTMDFFSVSTAKNAFTTVSARVTEYEAYTQPLFEVLVSSKIVHSWDKEIRRLSSTSLRHVATVLLRQNKREYCLAQLDELLKRTTSVSIAERHGSVMAVASMVAAFHSQNEPLPDDVVEKIAKLIPTIDSMRLFRGRGGEFIRQACCSLLETCAGANFAFPASILLNTGIGGREKKVAVVPQLLEFLQESYTQPLEWLQCDAVRAFRAFTAQSFKAFNAAGFHGKLVAKLLESTAENKSPNERRGAILTLGALPPVVLGGVGGEGDAVVGAVDGLVIDQLSKCTLLESTEETQDATSRQRAVEALVDTFVNNAGVECIATRLASPDHVAALFEVLLGAVGDYAVDKRGDVGSFVRIEAMRGMLRVMKTLVSQFPQSLTAKCVLKVTNALLKQSVEKIDKVRGVAGQTLQDVCLLLNETEETRKLACGLLPEFKLLIHTFDGVTDWSSPTDTFPRIIKNLVPIPEYRRGVLDGLVVSVGGLSVHVLKPALSTLLKLMREPPCPALPEAICTSLVELSEDYLHNERVSVPILLTCDRLVTAGCFHPSATPRLLQCLCSEFTHFSKDIQRLLPLVDVLASLTVLEEDVESAFRNKALHQALTVAASRYPKVRAKMGSALYTSLLPLSTRTHTNAHGADYVRAVDVLAATQWDGTNASVVRAARDELYTVLKVTKPAATTVAAAPAPSAAPAQKKDKLAYGALVKEMGY